MAGIAVTAALGIVLPGTFLPRLAIVTPIAYFIAFLADVCAALVLFATMRQVSGRRSMLVLALSFAANAVLTLLAFLFLPMMPLDPAVLATPLLTAIWLFIAWHFTAALGGLAYVAVRARDDGSRPSRILVAAAILLTIAVVTVQAVLAFLWVHHLPVLVDGSAVVRYSNTPVGPIVIGLLALASYAMFRVARPTVIERGLALSLFALTLEFGLLVIGQQRFTASFYFGRLLLLIGALSILIAAVRSLVEAQTRLRLVESTLLHVESEAAARAGRLRALREMAPRTRGAEELSASAILRIAADALRPEKAMQAYFSHLEGDGIVVDAISWRASDPRFAELSAAVYPGAMLSYGNTIMSNLTDAEPTRAWDDLSVVGRRGMLWERLGWQSFVGARATIGEKQYFVIFFSQELMTDDPFAQDDLAYVDVVTAFFASALSQKMLYERTQFQVEHDALTGLDNRLRFRTIVREEIRSGRPFAIAFADIDGFRFVNERGGNAIGDELLVEIAAGLSAVNAGNVVARMSGDEFGILVRGPRTRDETSAALKKYEAIFGAPFMGGALDETHAIRVTTSIGTARFPDDGDSVEQLMRRAGVALDIAKSRGGSASLIFDAPMEAILDDSRRRALEIAEAIVLDQFDLVYQPTFALATREVAGAEALIRWNHPQRGLLSPAEFIGFAERNGLIADLSRWVLHRLVRDVSGVTFPPGFRLYINLGAQMLDDIPFIAELSETLRTNPGLIGHLGIEVTETAAMQNVERSMHTIDLLRHWGFSVAIDDFGTGYSSLSYLKALTVDMIKIDQSFVAGLPGDERDCALTEMLLRITDRFGFATLAEGIETEEQAAWLLDHGCRYGQGFLVARPASLDQLLSRINARVVA
jgi:diguanylate cyclase (GGDEF)-like protein